MRFRRGTPRGKRTWAGARAQGILMSVVRTCSQWAVELFAFLLEVLCRPQPKLISAYDGNPFLAESVEDDD